VGRGRPPRSRGMGDLVVTCKWSYRERECECESERDAMVDDEDNNNESASFKSWSTRSGSTAASDSWI
jgi:phage-related protein